MEGTKPRTVSSLGMFDLLKGIGMLAIVFAHTAELYPLGTNDVTPFAFALFAYREALMAAFFIASGYGFRKRSIHKCIEQQVKTLLKPYLYTAAATTVLHCLIHHAAFGSWPNAITQSGKVLGGFLLGLPHTASYFGQEFFSCGPMWYLVALMLAWILLDVLLDIFPERYITPAVIGVTLLGWGITLVWEAPFCIAQGMVSLPYLYIGYLAKKRRLFETPLSGRARAGRRGRRPADPEHRLRLAGRVDDGACEHLSGRRSGLRHHPALPEIAAPGGRPHLPRHRVGGAALALHLLHPHRGADGYPVVSDGGEIRRPSGAGDAFAVRALAGVHLRHH